MLQYNTMNPTSKIRFETFSDSVFAIAITLLALELHVPYLPNGLSFQGLAPLVPSLLTFVLSFGTIAIFWVNHHQLTQSIDFIGKRRILWLNTLHLFFIILIPFVTETLSANAPSSPATALYAIVLFGASLSFSFLHYWIHRSMGIEKVPTKRSTVGPVIYLLAMLVPLFSVGLAYVLLAIPPLFYFLPKSTQKNSL
jgi:uncharacterized membrane protein